MAVTCCSELCDLRARPYICKSQLPRHGRRIRYAKHKEYSA